MEVVSRSDDVMGGALVFAGTRVPVSALRENLEAGVSVNEFLENFPTVTREQVIEYLRQANETMTKGEFSP